MRLFLVTTSVLFALVIVQNSTFSEPRPVIEFPGLIHPSDLVEVTSAADGLLATVNVDRGAVVKKGDVLATLESSVQKTSLDLAAATAAATGQLKTRQARVAYATAKLAQDEALFAKGLLSQLEIETSRTDKQVADAELIAAQEALGIAAIEEAQAKAALALRTIRSPFDGVIVQKFLSPGELLTRQSDKKILEVAQISPLRIELVVSVEHFGSIRVGDTAQVRPQAPVGGTYTATVKVVDRVIDAASGTFGVRLEIPNENQSLPAGLKCTVSIGN